MKLTQVEKWTRGKLALPALVSAYLVINAGPFYGAMKLLTHDRKNKKSLYGSKEWLAWHKQYAALFRCEDIEAWSHLYRQFFDALPSFEALRTIPQFADSPMVRAFPILKAGLENLRGADDLNRPPITDWIRAHFLDNFNTSDDESTPEERLDSWTPMAQSQFLVFTFKIFIPCIIYYRLSPAILMRRAIVGDLDSFGSLLSLDKNLLRVPEFSAIWEPVSRDPDSASFKRLTAAMDRSPHRGLTPMRVKTLIAVAIEVLFDGMSRLVSTGQSVSRPEIRALFDAYAQDTDHVQLDEDLPGTEDGWDAAIRREKNAWIEALREIT
jgi:hypothetical protein